MQHTIKYIFILFLFALSFTACEETESEATYVEIGDKNGTNKKYVYSYWAADYAQYLWYTDSLEDLMTGEINMKGKGVEQAGNMIPVGNRFFACSTGEDGGRSFYIDINGHYATRGREDRIYVESCYAYGNTDDNKSLIIGASWEGSTTGNEILVYDPISVSYTSRKLHNFGMELEGKAFSQWPTDILASGDYVYVSYYPKPLGQGWNVPATDTAYIKVLKYPSLEYVTDIKDTRTAPIGLYYANTSLVQTENGDIYTFSPNAYVVGFVPNKKPSAIMRIKKGTIEFDKDYFIDVESSILQGKVVSAYHAEGSKAVVMYIPKELDTPENEWAFTSTKTIFKSAVIDLETKEIIPVTGLPDHTGDNFYGYKSLYAENGKAYKSYLTGDEARIYEIDLATGKARAGAHITGGFYLPVISRINY